MAAPINHIEPSQEEMESIVTLDNETMKRWFPWVEVEPIPDHDAVPEMEQ